MQTERTGDDEEPPPLLHLNATYGGVLSPRTRITTEIGPQSGTIQSHSYIESHCGKSDTLPISFLGPVILRSEATNNPVPRKQATCRVKNETLRFAQGDIGKCGFCPQCIESCKAALWDDRAPAGSVVFPICWNIGQPPGATQPEKLVAMTPVGGPFSASGTSIFGHDRMEGPCK
jgi:hypothetical protein